MDQCGQRRILRRHMLCRFFHLQAFAAQSRSGPYARHSVQHGLLRPPVGLVDLDLVSPVQPRGADIDLLRIGDHAGVLCRAKAVVEYDPHRGRLCRSLLDALPCRRRRRDQYVQLRHTRHRLNHRRDGALSLADPDGGGDRPPAEDEGIRSPGQDEHTAGHRRHL